ncbi:glycosyltransferase family 4 protein [Roseovarius sp. M141]|uniref:glycosyltransferase family 4 protein n=1 Tax=Roseovarius sp. M141 TaxID=2583806 RepID=UPI0020CF1CC4|nr:glycosyltransferase [Roseovarius sp. M141]MCQ0090453.1 glycosyltransferase [Roseovarius sp. M141]
MTSSFETCLNAMRGKRYCLCVPISYHYDRQGDIWLDELWYHDLLEHLYYLPDLTVLAPHVRYDAADSDNLVRVDSELKSRLHFAGLGPEPANMREGILGLPTMIRSVWRAVRNADIVHSGIAGWPIPLGFVVNPIAVLLRRPLVIVIESAFWRIPVGYNASFKGRVRASLTEVFARWALRKARLAVYTHSAYLETLPVGAKGTAAVIPASWISASEIIPEADLTTSWNKKTKTARYLFPSRLVEGKGAKVMLDTIRCLENLNEPIAIDVIGSGDMRGKFETLACELKHVRLRVLDPVPYGAPFMTLLREYHAVIVPTVGDEQPRIIYDAFSQGIPVIASDTPGNREIVTAEQNGALFPAGQPNLLAPMLVKFAADPDLLRSFACSARETAATHTHTDMHLIRARLLTEIFG